MQYLCWRVLTGKNEKLKIAFMIAGHTKFSPDRFFGLIKKAYKNTPVSSLPDIEKLVSNSSILGKNIPLPTVDISGKRNVFWYDWSEFLSNYFSPIPAITKYHHFRFDHSSPGVVFVKEYSAMQEISVPIYRETSTIDTTAMPEIVHPPGMSLERRILYLYEKIRPFCYDEAAAELTCPQPMQALTSKSKTKPKSFDRKCSHCRQPGHTKTVRGTVTCPQLL